VEKNCNRLDVRATLSGLSPDMVLHEARYGKPVAQLSVRTASACVRTPPRENRIRLNLGFLKPIIEASRHVRIMNSVWNSFVLREGG
jgi:hypothetical protein